MKFEDIIHIVVGVLVSIGGGAAIVVKCSSFIGKIWAGRYEERMKATHLHEINEYKTYLEIVAKSTIRYSDQQFTFYNKLWGSLIDLKLLADQLWLKASSKNLVDFSKQLRITKNEIERSSLFIEEGHYKDLVKTLTYFADYQVGKQRLINYRVINTFDDVQVEIMIAENQNKKIFFEDLIEVIKISFKDQLKGQQLQTKKVVS